MMHRSAALLILLAPLLSCSSISSCSSPELPPVSDEQKEATALIVAAPTPTAMPIPTPTPETLPSPPNNLDLPSFNDDLDRESLAAALKQSLRFLKQTDKPEMAGCPTSEVREALAELREKLLRDEPVNQWVATHLNPQPVDAAVRITGYYEPVLEGRRIRGGRFIYPLYRRPNELVEVPLSKSEANAGRIFGRVTQGELEPYPSRRSIDGENSLAGRNLEIVWLADPVDRFFLHIQGSGVILLADGKKLRVGYAASNGRSYTSIGRLLLDRGLLAPGEASAQGIQRWLRAHPETRDEILFQNKRYIFFREAPGGPHGSLGLRLTAGRSVAIDPAAHSGERLLWLETRLPEINADGKLIGYRPIHRFILPQDAGAAITGPGRLDLFLGTGTEAGLIAGNLHESGNLWTLSPCAPETSVPSGAL